MSQVAHEGTTTPATVAASATAWQPQIVALICNWCTYAGADMAGTTRRAYPASVRAIRVPCTGRIDPLLIVKAFEQGADGVVVSGCHPGDCHYVQGNLVARRRFTAMRALMEFLGLDARRLHFAWVSASEGMKWSQLVEGVTAAVHEAGPLRDWGKLTERERAAVCLPALPAAPRPAAPAGDHESIAKHLQSLATTLLGEQSASVVIGYTAGSLPDQMVPTFVTAADQTATLGWSDRCFNDLAVYLPSARKQWGKVAVVVKQCDARAAVGLLQESQIPREDVILVGVSCDGVRPRGELAAKCYPCDGEVASICDFTVTSEGVQRGAVASGGRRAVAADPRDALVQHLESLPADSRWAYWQGEFERCLRCYACRAACPLCYCAVCVAEKNQPQWVPTNINAKGNLTWNITRAFHLTGRCAGCDECARVCPADLRLDLINHRMAKEIEGRYGYRAGLDPAVSPPLATFKPDDAQEFIR
jgi:coenzyme F420-reducing hydrogenase delta subunit/ferredoxin